MIIFYNLIIHAPQTQPHDNNTIIVRGGPAINPCDDTVEYIHT